MDRVARLGQPRRRAVPGALARALRPELAARPRAAREEVDLASPLGLVPQGTGDRKDATAAGPSRTARVLFGTTTREGRTVFDREAWAASAIHHAAKIDGVFFPPEAP